MSKPLILLVGKSGSGKNYIADYMEKEYHMKVLQSYTSREPRSRDKTGTPNEKGHIFATEEDYKSAKHKVAATYYKGHHYWATEQQCDEADIYIIDVQGVKSIKRNYTGKRLVIVYLDVNPFTRFYRMLKRGDGIKKACQRIWYDYNEFYGFSKKPDVFVIKRDTVNNIAAKIFYKAGALT